MKKSITSEREVTDISVAVSHDFLAKAEEQVGQILLKQRLAYNERLFGSFFAKKIIPILRVIGLVLSALVLAICVAATISDFDLQVFTLGSKALTVASIFSFLFFYLMLRIDSAVKGWVDRVSIKQCKKIAKSSVAAARKKAPYTALYHLQDNIISYNRKKDGKSDLVWTKKLSGVAIQSELVTLTFREWSSCVPLLVILQSDRELVKKSLSERDIECRHHLD